MRAISSVMFLIVAITFADGQAQPKVTTTTGKLVTEKFQSTVLQENKVGLNLDRDVKVYLPAGYEQSKKSYPVVYYCHNMWSSNGSLFENGRTALLLDRAFANKVIGEFILVAPDYSSQNLSTLYENSIVSGRWLDYTVQEVVPFVDRTFRTIKNKDSRAVIGDFMGGRGALALAMTHAETFGTVYALHPVATGSGYLPWSSLQIDWNKMINAKSLDDLQGAGAQMIFLKVCQAFLPNVNKPPFFCDFYMDVKDGITSVDAPKLVKAQRGFHLEESLAESVSNLKSMRGIAFDWGRFDGNQDHVYSAREFSRRLEDLGIEHEAEEYRGDPFNKVWLDNGRFYSRVLPFLGQHLVFEK